VQVPMGAHSLRRPIPLRRAIRAEPAQSSVRSTKIFPRRFGPSGTKFHPAAQDPTTQALGFPYRCFRFRGFKFPLSHFIVRSLGEGGWGFKSPLSHPLCLSLASASARAVGLEGPPNRIFRASRAPRSATPTEVLGNSFSDHPLRPPRRWTDSAQGPRKLKAGFHSMHLICCW
jgi:hypothetical protein